jgi:hypothetical protein
MNKLLIAMMSAVLILALTQVYINIKSLQPSEITQEQVLNYLDNHRETLTLHPSDAVYHLQKSLNQEGYKCEIDDVLGSETITAYNHWRVKQ